MPVLVLSEGGMDVSRDPFGAVEGAVGILVKRLLAHLGAEIGDAGIEFDFWRRMPSGTTVRGNDKRLALTIGDISRSRRDVSAIVVVIDADGDGPRRLITLKNGRQEAADKGIALADKTSVGVAVEMVEAWLLGDHNEVSRYFNRPEGGRDPEGHTDPKAVIEEWTDSSEKDLTDAYSELANRCDLTVVANRCASFKKFVEDVKSHRP